MWRAHQLAAASVGGSAVAPTGHAELDAQLPGGGWPARLLTELLLPHPGVGELRLLAPALAAVQRSRRGLMWFDPPIQPCAGSLLRLGLDLQQLVIVRSRPLSLQLAQPRPQSPARPKRPAADLLWALEQALKSGHLGAAVAWLPARLPADALRRLQLAAQAHDGPVFLLRDAQEQGRPSAAPLRLLLASAGADRLQLTLLKRRGPPLAAPLTLALPGPAALPAARVRRSAVELHEPLEKAAQPQPVPATPATAPSADAVVVRTAPAWPARAGSAPAAVQEPPALKPVQSVLELVVTG